ncbi:casein kinase I isoform delta, partial [Diplogelasinospora grovesii]
DILIDRRYRLDCKIGEGGFGLVYSGTDLESDEEVAIKLTYVRDAPEVLRGEAETYEALSGGIGIPRVRWFGQECDFYILVHDLLGPSLEDLFNYCGRKFSLKTILLIADQAISRIEYIHSKGFLHRDIKPDNFLMGIGRQGHILYTIDFGLAKEFSDAEHRKNVEGLPLGGTRRYASINNHNGRGRYPLTIPLGDDLESLRYVFVYFARGSLPWQGLKAATDDEKDERIKEMKESLSGEALCDGVLPREFATYINYTRSLGFDDKPDYSYLRGLFRRLFAAEGFKHDNVFDWTEKRFYEICSKANRRSLT